MTPCIIRSIFNPQLLRCRLLHRVAGHVTAGVGDLAQAADLRQGVLHPCDRAACDPQLLHRIQILFDGDAAGFRGFCQFLYRDVCRESRSPHAAERQKQRQQKGNGRFYLVFHQCSLLFSFGGAAAWRLRCCVLIVRCCGLWSFCESGRGRPPRLRPRPARPASRSRCRRCGQPGSTVR